jgi:succinate-acetate transporter protein
MLWKAAIGLSCIIYDIETNAYLVCIMKHTIYGSFAIIFTALTIVFLISISLAEPKKKHQS